MKSALQSIALKLVASSGMQGIIVNDHTPDARRIRMQIEALASCFDFISHDELEARLRTRRKKPFCLFTFDDGKKINALETAPEMERLGVSGVFYIVTDFAASGEVLWADRYAALKREASFDAGRFGLESPKKLPYRVLEERLKDACAHVGVTANAADPRVGLMNWDEIRRLHDRGFTIGSHTCRHAIMTNEPESDAKADIERSLRSVTRELGAPCRSLAFPNGGYTKELCAHAAACGATTVMTTDPRWVSRRESPDSLPRIQIYDFYDRNRVALKILAAAPGVLLKNPNGAGREYVLGRLRRLTGLA